MQTEYKSAQINRASTYAYKDFRSVYRIYCIDKSKYSNCVDCKPLLNDFDLTTAQIDLVILLGVTQSTDFTYAHLIPHFVNTSATTTRGLQCPPGVPRSTYLKEYGQHCYEFVLGRSERWPDAENDCKRKSGHLVAIGSFGEQQFVYNSVRVNICLNEIKVKKSYRALHFDIYTCP